MPRTDPHLEPLRPAPVAPNDRPASPLTALAAVVAFLFGFVAVTVLMVPPHPEDEILRAKWETFTSRASEFDGVFFGSSRIHRGFDPATFATVTGARGEPIRVFNFGLLYGRPHELDGLIEETLRAHRAKYVFVELMDWAPSINTDLADQDRTLRWHTPRQTASAIRTTWRSNVSTIEKLWTTGQHVGHLLKRSVNFGGGPLRLRTLLSDDSRHAAWFEAIANNDGWIQYEQETDPRYEQERRAFLDKYVRDYRRQVSGVDATNAEPGSLAYFNTSALRDQQALIRRHGAEPIYVVPNLRQGTPGWHRLDDEGAADTLFTFNHVARYPELYAVENHFDRRHLNTEGARHFTRHLAQRFAEWRETAGHTK